MDKSCAIERTPHDREIVAIENAYKHDSQIKRLFESDKHNHQIMFVVVPLACTNRETSKLFNNVMAFAWFRANDA